MCVVEIARSRYQKQHSRWFVVFVFILFETLKTYLLEHFSLMFHWLMKYWTAKKQIIRHQEIKNQENETEIEIECWIEKNLTEYVLLLQRWNHCHLKKSKYLTGQSLLKRKNKNLNDLRKRTRIQKIMNTSSWLFVEWFLYKMFHSLQDLLHRQHLIQTRLCLDLFIAIYHCCKLVLRLIFRRLWLIHSQFSVIQQFFSCYVLIADVIKTSIHRHLGFISNI